MTPICFPPLVTWKALESGRCNFASGSTKFHKSTGAGSGALEEINVSSRRGGATMVSSWEPTAGKASEGAACESDLAEQEQNTKAKAQIPARHKTIMDLFNVMPLLAPQVGLHP